MNTLAFRIAIDARPLSGSPCGYTIYLNSILDCLRASNFEITLLSNKPIKSLHGVDPKLGVHVFGEHGDMKWEQKSLPKYLESQDYDIYFSGANRGMPFLKRKKTRYVIGILDVIPYIFFKDYFLKRIKAWLTTPHLNRETAAQIIAVARADAILTISRQSALDIQKIFRRRAVTAIPIRLKNEAISFDRITKPQFVYVGGIDIRKKVDVLLQGFAKFRARHPNHAMILVGSDFTSLSRQIAEMALDGHVVMTGYVDDATKFRILGESLAMVYPSLYEGYGLAIAEGFQAGIPVVAGVGGSQAEIGGSATRLIDPTSPDEIADAMEEMLDPEIRKRWIELGRRQYERLGDPRIKQRTIDYFAEQGLLARRQCSV